MAVRAFADFDAIGCKVESGIDQRDVAEGLGEVADHAVVLGVVFLTEQADIVTQSEQALK